MGKGGGEVAVKAIEDEDMWSQMMELSAKVRAGKAQGAFLFFLGTSTSSNASEKTN